MDQKLPKKPEIQRLARKGGVTRVSKFVYGDVRIIAQEIAKDIMAEAGWLAHDNKRSTVKTRDVAAAIKLARGNTVTTSTKITQRKCSH